MDLGLKGKTAVITGGSVGIGLAIAEGLAAEGTNLILSARGRERRIADEAGSGAIEAHGEERDGATGAASAPHIMRPRPRHRQPRLTVAPRPGARGRMGSDTVQQLNGVRHRSAGEWGQTPFSD